MQRVLVLFFVLAGCQQQPAAPVAQTPNIPQPALQPGDEIAFADWPSTTGQPISVSPNAVLLCRPPVPQEDGQKKHGPHFKPSIVVRVNPTAIEDFKGGKPLPVGTTVVKEKHNTILAHEPPTEYGAMVKREPGYDPQHGDWEYVYVVRQPEKKITRGRLESCIECHSHAKEKDYLFRTYLPGKVPAVSDW